MDWLKIANEAFQALVPLVITALAGTLLTFIGKQIKQLQVKSGNELTNKYLDLLDKIITNAVLATTQTYVDALKNKDAFDKEAQTKAFKMTYDTVMQVLTDDARACISEAVGDLELYITNQIESTIKLYK